MKILDPDDLPNHYKMATSRRVPEVKGCRSDIKLSYFSYYLFLSFVLLEIVSIMCSKILPFVSTIYKFIEGFSWLKHKACVCV